MWTQLFVLLFGATLIFSTLGTSQTSIIEVIAPELRIDPKETEDLNLCYSVQVPEGETVYATSFIPTHGAKAAHHIKLYSCEPGVTKEKVWACGPEPISTPQYTEGPVCQGEDNDILYVWAKNAASLNLPDDVGFELKPGSHLVVALHYKGAADYPKEVTPGVNVVVTKKQPSKLANVLMMHSSKNSITPHTTEFWDMECTIKEGVETFYPFAFRVHSHHLGKGVLGYKIDAKTKHWTLIGAEDPNLPQNFYPTQTSEQMSIKPGDMLAARCIMVNDGDETIYTGAKDSDEMCVYYIMFFTKNNGRKLAKEQIMNRCTSKSKKGRWDRWFDNIPKEASSFKGITYMETDPKQYESKSSNSLLNILAPQLRIQSSEVEDLQLCFAVQVDNNGPSFVTGFEPTEGAMIIAHHMRLFACAPGMRKETVWSCGSEGNPFPNDYAWGPPCLTEEKTIYVWAKNASKLELPEDVGFQLQPGSHIVMALHYKNPKNVAKEITPGIIVNITKERPSKLAGVFQLINDFNQIGPGRTEFWDTACMVEDGILPFYPFAFRVHAHHIGKAIMGYKVDGETNEWTRIGIKDPMLPHAFYPVQTNGYVQISPGDKLAARCIMVNDQSNMIMTGPKDSDEMCIFYVMYYIEVEKWPDSSQVMNECLSLANRGNWSNYFDYIPPDASQYNGITYKADEPEPEDEQMQMMMAGPTHTTLNITAPVLKIDPKKVEDLQLCYAVQVPSDGYSYAIGFEPTEGAMKVAHHMRLFACAPGARTQEAWVCGPEGNLFPDEYQWAPPCMTEEKTIYVWAKNASKLDLPDDVGFHLPPGSHIVLALHYKNPGDTPKDITPGINVSLTKKRPSKMAGVFQMVNDYNEIPPNRTEFWDVSCQVSDGILPFYPFAFRVHSHHIGRAVMGYKVDGETNEWTKIGIMDPMLPHAFYPVQTNGYVKISAGDKLASRCIMVNDQDHTIRTGPKDSDEMCIFYVMYYVETEKDKEPDSSQLMNECLSLSKRGRWNNWFEKVPTNTNEYRGITYHESSAQTGVIEMIAPELRVSPDKTADMHLCYSVQIPEGDDVYAVGFEPTPGAIVAHHMKLFSCAPAIRTDNVWACGPTPFDTDVYQSGTDCLTDEQMLYVWAKNASRLDLPEDVGFHLKAGSHLVLSLHYKGVSNLPASVTPGVNVIVTKQRPSKRAGVFMMVNSFNFITPKTTEFWDVACQVPDGTVPFYPFAFRTHSHHLTRGIMGFKVDGGSKEWTLIGQKDPMLPQGFYPSPLNGTTAVYPGDMLASRCIMVNDLNKPVYTGPTDSDEMCIFYIMYYVDDSGPMGGQTDTSGLMKDCSSAGKNGRWNNWFSNVPTGSDTFAGIRYKESFPKKEEKDPGKRHKLFMKRK